MLTFSKYITTAQSHSARQPLSRLYKPKFVPSHVFIIEDKKAFKNEFDTTCYLFLDDLIAIYAKVLFLD
jgi:hypothetical protein